MPKTNPSTEMPAPLPATIPVTGQWRSMAFSFTFHLLLLLLVFGLTYSSGGGGDSIEPDRSGGIVLTVQSKSTAEKEYLEETDLEANEALSESASTSASSPPTESTAPEIEASPAVADMELPGLKSSNIDVNRMTNPAGGGYKPSHELSDEARDIMAAFQAGQDASKPAGPATSLSVFGTGQLEGRSFLFLLDRSQSMGSTGLGVVQIARNELTAAIEKLDSHHKFQILGYNNSTTPMRGGQNLLSASRENKLEVPKFIGAMAAYGPTNHIVGIMSAISYRPDVIVILTDGGSPGLNEFELKRIRNASRGQIQIHCVQFGLGPQRFEDQFMGLLAAQNGGTFKYVDINEWQK